MSRAYMYSQESRFAEAEEIKNGMDRVRLDEKKSMSGGLPIISDGMEMYVEGSDVNSLIVAGPGSGKSRRVALPLILSTGAAGHSMIVHDPKGELTKGAYHYLSARNYRIHILNFRNPSYDKWNPLLHGAKLYAEGNEDLAAEAFAEVAEALYQQVETKEDPYWTIAASDLFVGLCLLACHFVKPEEVTIAFVYSLFIEGEKRIGPSRCLKEYLSRYGTPIVENALAGVLDAPNDTRASINAVFSSMLSRLVISRKINHMLSGSSFEPEDFVKKKTALFIVSKDESSVYNGLISVMINELYVRLIELAEKGNGTLKRRIEFVFDEFSNLTKIPDFSSKISACRSRNIRMHLFVQSLNQLNTTYGEDIAQTILGCCDDWMLFHSPEPKMLTLFSERCGSYVTQYTNVKRPLLSTSQLQHFSKEKGEALLLLGRNYPYVTALPDKSVYEEKLGLKELDKIPKAEEVKDEPVMFSLRKELERRVEEELDKLKKSNGGVEEFR